MEEDNSADEAYEFPFGDAFEEDTNTYPYGTFSAVASHVCSPRLVALAAARLGQVDDQTLFVDLGCGIGAVSNLVGREFGCRVVGVDCCEAQLVEARLAAPPRARYLCCDLFALPEHVAVTEADLVFYIYLIPKMVNHVKLRDMLEPYLTQGARVVTSTYHPDYWHAKATDDTFSLRLFDKTTKRRETSSNFQIT
ncbi:hypothetical protein TrLO_g437 [Triparma laevis f. longispina]|uniref:Methyltransferase domain-containing protein n=1 Tax=Triparma laevis f. longispina TaxID=1714387 RepID=A0A9W7E9N7_9STRA|nr:hypothetical protein TrLO_g437 [Triparma laevis f. longispina]